MRIKSMRIRNPGQNSGALDAQTELWKAVDAHNGGVEAQNGALEGF